MQPQEKLAVTVPEAVAMSGIGVTSLYALNKKKKLVFRKQGRRTLILVSELRAYLEGLPSFRKEAA